MLENSQTLKSIPILGVDSPRPVKLETIEVQVSVDQVADEYVKGFIGEFMRKNPKLFERCELTEEELRAYIHFFLTQRVAFVHQRCRIHRKLQTLWLPAFLQNAIAMIGEVIIHEDGLRFIPVMRTESEMTFEEAQKISDKLYLTYGTLQVLRNGFPRSPLGERDVMTTVLINDCTRSYLKLNFVQSSYVAAFLNLRLKEEMKFHQLFRKEYDFVHEVAFAISTEPALY